MSLKKRKTRQSSIGIMADIIGEYKWTIARFKGHCGKCHAITEKGEKVLRNHLEPQYYLCNYCGETKMAKLKERLAT